MKTIRLALTSISVLLLAGGYALSQWSFFAGNPSVYAAQMDQPAVRWLATFLLFTAIGMVFLKEEEDA